MLTNPVKVGDKVRFRSWLYQVDNSTVQSLINVAIEVLAQGFTIEPEQRISIPYFDFQRITRDKTSLPLPELLEQGELR